MGRKESNQNHMWFTDFRETYDVHNNVALIDGKILKFSRQKCDF